MSLRDKLEVLYQLCDALCRLQIVDESDENFGAIRCIACNTLHTRAGEAVYPLAVAYKHSGKEKYLMAAIRLGNWLVSEQREEGFWYETPEKWTGTTTFQLLALSAAYLVLKDKLSIYSRELWKQAIARAANWLISVMSETFANINYSATTSASLALSYKILRRPEYLIKAKELAHLVVKKINEEGFIVGEGAIENGRRTGIDLGYNLDMSLGTLALYCLITKDDLVKRKILKALKTHLLFVYPDGSIDDSWGSRSYKWTTYGSKTAHGCQMAFDLLADEDPRFAVASSLNLAYLRKMIRRGLVGYGPHSWIHDPSFTPCIYPTFTRAENLAFAIEYGAAPKKRSPIPSQKKNWFKYFSSINVVLVRTDEYMATVTAYSYNYGYKDRRYITLPTGGCISNLWWKGYGLMQTSSQTVYERPEPMHMPIERDLLPLTPRIEYYENEEYYTNLYEINGKLSLHSGKGVIISVSCRGSLKSRNFENSGINYILTYEFYSRKLVKRLKLECEQYQLKGIKVIEPIVKDPDVRFVKKNRYTVLIEKNNETWIFQLLSGRGELFLGVDEEKYWCPFPSIECFPISIGSIKSREITYAIIHNFTSS